MNELEQGNALDFLQHIAAATPTPGGGSVAAYVGAIGASLALMAIRISMKRKAFRDLSSAEQTQMQRNVVVLERAQTDFLYYYRADIEAYSAYMAGMPYEKETEKEAKLTRCLEVPYELAEFTIRIGYETLELEPYVAVSIRSDFTLAYSLWTSVLQASASNIRANLAHLKSPATHERVQSLLDTTLPTAQTAFRLKGEAV